MSRRWILGLLTVATLQVQAGNGVERDEWESPNQAVLQLWSICTPVTNHDREEAWDSNQRILLEQDAAELGIWVPGRADLPDFCDSGLN